jgi:outer membrane protein
MEKITLKNHIHLLVLILGILLSPHAAAELKIGFVNALKLMDTAPQVEEANKRLESEFAPRQRRLMSAQQEIKTLEDQLTKDSAIMSETEARKIGRDVRDKKREFQRQQEEFREDYNLRRNEELAKIQKIIVEIIQELAKEEAYDFILSDGVVWASKQVDITDNVLARLEKQQQRRKK